MARKRLIAVRKRMRQLVRIVKRESHRGTIPCGTGLDLLDVAFGTMADAVQARAVR